MKKIIVFVIVILGILFFLRFVVGGPEDSWICVNGNWVKHGHPSSSKPVTDCNQKKPAIPRTKDDCLAKGGVWKKQGPEPFETCNIKTKDGGNICYDESECQGTCLVKLSSEELREGMKGKIFQRNGNCSAWIVTLGCQTRVKNGKASVICVD